MRSRVSLQSHPGETAMAPSKCRIAEMVPEPRDFFLLAAVFEE
jgi:hypothetical protein